MSHSDLKSHKMNRQEARKLVNVIMAGKHQSVVFTKHAREELLKDNLTTVDAINVLKSPDAKICLVVAFESAKTLIVVTAWRK